MRSMLFVFLLVATANAVDVFLDAPAPAGPVRFGADDLRTALTAAGLRVVPAGVAGGWRIAARVARAPSVPDRPESFAIVPVVRERRIDVIGSDVTGLMYGLEELAERVAIGTPLERLTPARQSPFLEFRAPNPFFSLPDPVVDDWEHWWFRSDDFWQTYLDLLARSRFNWIDMHGMLHIRGRWSFPNIFPYFVTSRSFPNVGLAPAEQARNLAQLNHVIAMARDRGIRLALMSYTTSWNVPGAPKPSYPETEANLALYTRECVAELLRQCPGLGMLGFRIGESGKSEDFFKQSYVPGVMDTGTLPPISTRTWLSSKPKILELARAYPGALSIEIKYNGEHYGLPYQVAGGRMAGWHSYSYQDYCQPPEPYRILWQNRASGTHRLWRWGDPEWVRRTVETYRFDGGRGFSLEPPNAYRPMYDYYHRRPELKWFTWVHQRDWFWNLLWGRLSYDPTVADGVWLAAMGGRFGRAAAPAMLQTSRRMSRVISLIYDAHCQGPDHLNMAPELETGGSLADFAAVPPLDLLAMQPIGEYVQRLVSGNLSARTSPLQMADAIEAAARDASAAVEQAGKSATESQAELADWQADVNCLGHLGRYYATKLRAATALELYRATADPAHLQTARTQAGLAVDAWRELARVTADYYQPIVESMRPLTEKFRWSDLTASVEADLLVPDKVKAEVEARGAQPVAGVAPRELAPLAVTVTSRLRPDGDRKRLEVRVAAKQGGLDGAAAWLVSKPLASETAWRRRRMTGDGSGLTAALEVDPGGALWAVEVVTKTAGACWPDWRKETPYRVIDAWGEAPPASQRALPDLAKLDLGRRRFSAVLCGRVASQLIAAPPAQKQVLLDQVAGGQTLVIFDQDYPAFDPSWLPGGVKGSDDDFNEFRLVGKHPLLEGLPPVVRVTKIVNDALSGGDAGWQRLTEPWGLAVRQHGEGEIILCQLRLEETWEQPASAQLLRNLLSYARRGSRLPVLMLDEGNGEVPAALAALGLEEWVGAEEAAR